MEQVVLIIHLILAVALVGVILIQRSEGGGLGIGGGQGGMGSFASVRGTANFLTRTTTILASAFIATSLILAIMSGAHKNDDSILNVGLEPVAETPVVPTPPTDVPVEAPAAAAQDAKPQETKPETPAETPTETPGENPRQAPVAPPTE